MNNTFVAIIIPAFNKAHLTNLCIDSIFKAKSRSQFKIIVIDNNSHQSEFEKLKVLSDFVISKAPESLVLVRNEKNLGFAGAINQGLKIALSQSEITHICLLNNDTIVTDYWLDDLTEHSSRTFVGPVCNSVGNEQIVEVDYTTHGFNGYTTKEVNSFACKWRMKHFGNTVPTRMLGFFCVLGERQLFETVGPLDESFGLGYYEDDDYCLRIIENGFKQAIVRYVFVHHWGSASFKELSDQALHKLFSNNRARFISKHGVEPVDHSASWLTTILHEYDWLKEKHLDLSEVYKWIPKMGYGPLKYEILAKLKKKTALKVKPKILRSVLLFIIKVFSRHSVWKDARKFIIESFEIGVSKYLQFPISKVPLKRWRNKTIIIFPIQPFVGRMQRPQQLAVQLSECGYNVLWIDPEPERNKSQFQKLRRIRSGIYTFALQRIDYTNFYTSSLNTTDASRITDAIEKLLPRGSLKQSIAIVQSPFWHVIDMNAFKCSVYDCMDAHDAFGSATMEVSAIEELMITKAHKIVTTSQYLHDKINRDFGRDSLVVRNACTPTDFDTKRHLTDSSRKKIGYFGAIAEWFDTDLLVQVAELLPQFDFVLVGNTSHSTFSKRQIPTNVTMLGELPYTSLPEHAATWSAGIIPFIVTELIKATNPVKLYEYYALGLPVVATPIPEVSICTIPAYTAKMASDFAEQIKLALSEDSVEKQLARKQFANQQTWKHRAQEFSKYIEQPEC
jgi:GT2 family glycosyltransferase